MLEPRTIVYDGVCVLCSRWLGFVLKRDKRGLYRFAAMQTPPGQALLAANGLDPRDPSSFLLLDNGVAYSNSDAIIRVLVSFGGLWRLAHVLRIIPPLFRDSAYLWLARNRYRLFGKLNQCAVPSAATAHRFLR